MKKWDSLVVLGAQNQTHKAEQLFIKFASDLRGLRGPAWAIRLASWSFDVVCASGTNLAPFRARKLRFSPSIRSALRKDVNRSFTSAAPISINLLGFSCGRYGKSLANETPNPSWSLISPLMHPWKYPEFLTQNVANISSHSTIPLISSVIFCCTGLKCLRWHEWPSHRIGTPRRPQEGPGGGPAGPSGAALLLAWTFHRQPPLCHCDIRGFHYSCLLVCKTTPILNPIFNHWFFAATLWQASHCQAMFLSSTAPTCQTPPTRTTRRQGRRMRPRGGSLIHPYVTSNK